MTLSMPASVRNVMQDLEQLGLVFMRRTPSAGRLPTETGLRFFVDALMQVGDLTQDDRHKIEGQVAAAGKSVDGVLTEASQLLSGLTHSAGVVLATKANVRLKHIEFVRLEPERALVVLVAEDGHVENRILNLPVGLPTSRAGVKGFELSQRPCPWQDAGRGESRHGKGAGSRAGRTRRIDQAADRRRARELVRRRGRRPCRLIVRGHANLLDDLTALQDLERVRQLFDDLETKRGVTDLLGRAEGRPTACAFLSVRKTGCFRCPVPRPLSRLTATPRAGSWAPSAS